MEQTKGISYYNGSLLRRAQVDASISLFNNTEYPEGRRYPLELEEELVCCISTYNAARAREIVVSLLEEIRIYEGDQTENIRIRVIELCALLSRTAIRRGTDTELVLELTRQLITQILTLESTETFLETFCRNLEIYTFNLLYSPEGGNSLVRSVASFVLKHIAEDITLEKVSSQMGITPSYLSSRFRKITGITFKEYVNIVRIEEAKRLLANTDHSVMEIAIACGYKEQSYFSKVFKKLTGITPTQYR